MTSERSKVFLSFTFIALIILSFVPSVMTSGLNSGVALFLEQEGHPAATAGFLIAVFTAASTIARFVTGDITDHANHEKLLLVGTIVEVVGTSIPIFNDSLPVLVVARAVQGVSFCILSTVATVLVAEFVPKQFASTGQGYRGLGNALGNAIGPSVAVLTVGIGGGRGLHLAITLLCLVGLVFAVILRMRGIDKDKPEEMKSEAAAEAKKASVDEGDEEEHRSLLHRVFEPKVMPQCITEFVRRMINGICTSFVVLFGLNLGIEQASVFFLISSAVVVMCRLFAGKWMDNANGYLVMSVMCVTCIVGFLLMAIAPGAPSLMIAGLAYGTMEGLGSPYMIARTMQVAPEKHRGVASSNYFLLGDAGTAFGAWVGGILIDAHGFSVLPWFVIAASALTLVISVLLKVPGNIEK